MLYLDIIDASEVIDVNKTRSSKNVKFVTIGIFRYRV